MNTISIGGKKYVKATDIARELGYTRDYVGQLCRGKKVDSHLVGRSWYVSENSIREYRQTRYKTNTKIIHRTASKNNGNKIHYYDDKQFYTQTSQNRGLNYFTDKHDLIPVSKYVKGKTGKLSIYDSSLSSNVETLGTDDTLIKHISVEKKKEIKSNNVSSAAKKIKVIHRKSVTKKNNKKILIEHNIDGVISMQTYGRNNRNPTIGTSGIATNPNKVSMLFFRSYIILISVVISLMVSLVIIGLQSVTKIYETSITTLYLFETESVKSSIVQVWLSFF